MCREFYLFCSEYLDRRTPETDSPNPWGSIQPRLRTTALEYGTEGFKGRGLREGMSPCGELLFKDNRPTIFTPEKKRASSKTSRRYPRRLTHCDILTRIVREDIYEDIYFFVMAEFKRGYRATDFSELRFGKRSCCMNTRGVSWRSCLRCRHIMAVANTRKYGS